MNPISAYSESHPENIVWSPDRGWHDEITKQDYQRAIDVQDASNLSGVVHSLAEIMTRMVKLGWSNDQRESHPIVRLYVAKIADLAGLSYTWPGLDYDECVRLAYKGES